MGKTFLKVGLFIFVLIFLANGRTSFAANTDLNIISDPLEFNIINIASDKETKDRPITKSDQKAEAKPAKPNHKLKKAPKSVKYTIKSGDTLTLIAQTYKTTWQRLFDKNTKISNPDSVNPGEVITIPRTSEKLAKRAVIEVTPKLATAVTEVTQSIKKLVPYNHTTRSGSSAGNTYTPGYCTWYVKNRRPDLPNSLGNAGAWTSNAAAQGIPTGSTPRVGAVGQQGNHVAYVEKVNSNGTVSISEMNYGGGLFVVHHRTVPAGNFTYIY